MRRSTQETTVSQESIDKFRSSLCAGGRSAQTAKAYATDLKVMLTDLDETELPIEEFESTATNWLTGTRNLVSPKTTTRRITSVRAFARWAGLGPVLTDYRAPTPAKGEPHPLPEGVEGVRKMIRVASNEKQEALIALCGLVGCRVGEALALRPVDFDLPHQRVTIRGKGDKTRRVPVSAEAWSVIQVPFLHAFAEQGRPIVPLSNRFARRVITDVGRRAGLSRTVASHDLRATFATEVYDRTKDIRLVQILLGHASVETTQLYVDVYEDKLRQAVEL